MISPTGSIGILERFTTPLVPDVYLAALNPRWSRATGVIEQILPHTSTAASIVIRPGRAWRAHRPGQFVTIGVDINGVRHHRCYSLTSVPGRADGRIEITVQAVDCGTVSHHLVHRAAPGDTIQLGSPAGEFVLPTRPTAGLLFISGGSGLTPLMCMLRTLAASPPAVDVVMVHHVTSDERLLFRDELARLATTSPWLTLALVRTREPGGRHLDADGLEQFCPDWRSRSTYVCGPTSMIDFAIGHWADSGLTDRLNVESFRPQLATSSGSEPADPSDRDASGSVARFSRSDTAVVADPSATLLDVAEGAGLAPAAGCRMGICHTCSTPLESGCVRDLRDGRVLESGSHVQLCVSAAVGDVTLGC